MEFEYLGKRFIIVELVNPINNNETLDILQVMEIVFDKELEMEKYKFINYFYGASLSENEIMEIAIEYIDKYMEEKRG